MTSTQRIITLAVTGAAVGVASGFGHFALGFVFASLGASALTFADFKAGKFNA